MKALEVLSAGILTTVQDLGRFQARHVGVPQSGSLDDFSHRIANWLVGNDQNAAVLEMTIQGGNFRVLCPMDIAVTGADMSMRVNGISRKLWNSIRVIPGDTLTLGGVSSGCRSYLAMSGGVDVPLVLGSRSTCLQGRFGGLNGRALQTGDVVHRVESTTLPVPRGLHYTPMYSDTAYIRAIPGPHDICFHGQLKQFFSEQFVVSATSNRMGCRLQGATLVGNQGTESNILSQPCVAGNIQVPMDGNPIILLREQTIGGYASIATVLSIDLHKIAQAAPGSRLSFVSIGYDEAKKLIQQWHSYLREIQNKLELA